jgi:hypothetical protein
MEREPFKNVIDSLAYVDLSRVQMEDDINALVAVF